MYPDEQPLTGGNATTGVVRVGATVRRPAGPWTPAVHALLEHLRAVGFTGAPRPLGLDERGREVLAYQPGRVAWPDHFDRLAPPAQLARVGRLIREYHDAVAGFTPPTDARWQSLIPVPPEEPREIIAHHDLAPWNLIIDQPDWVFIDWDGAGPGSRLWDLAYAVHGFVPLSSWASDHDARLRTLVDAYGLDQAQRLRLVTLLAPRTRSMFDFLKTRAAAGVQPWTRLFQEGHGDAWRSDTEHIEHHEAHWRRLLTDYP